MGPALHHRHRDLRAGLAVAQVMHEQHARRVPLDACTQLGGITAGTSVDPLPGTYATVTNGRGPGLVAGLACATAVALVHRRLRATVGGIERAGQAPGSSAHGGRLSRLPQLL